MRRDPEFHGSRGWRVVWLAIATCVLAGCGGGKTIVVENRPAWVMEAEQRLQAKPTWSVDQESAGAPATRPIWGSRPTTVDNQQEMSENADSGMQSAPRSRPQPAGVTWGETQITVQVEE